ncbi:MAG: dihydrodipicolinate synthase family protein [Pirellulaceae bacterium]|nr:dihydrodipicolinate synthase family protein [Pirellulaceae bacterium]
MPFDLNPFRGVFPAGMTFFDRAGDLDEAATVAHWKWLADQGVDGLVIAGTSGEFVALSNDERLRLFELATEHLGGHLPLIAGSGHASTKWTVELSQRAEALGMDALIVILPYYSRPPLPAVLAHFDAVRAATDSPIMLYNNPANTALPALAPDVIADMVERDVVHMVKSTMESVTPVHDLAAMVGDKMRIFYGSFLSAFEGFAAGAHGWVSGVLNVAAPVAQQMYRAIKSNDLDLARSHWHRILPIVHLYTYQRLGPAADIPIYRAMLEQWGRHGGFSRQPFAPLDEDQIAELARQLELHGWQRPPDPMHHPS